MCLEHSAKRKVLYEIGQIKKEFEIIDLLLKKLNSSNLDPIEIRAAATSMQSIYNGYDFIRHAYSFMLDNELLEPLIKNMPDLFEIFHQEIINGQK